MTKTDFRREAERAHVPPELLGAVLAGPLRGEDGVVTDGRVDAIVWLEDWTTESRYSPTRGEYTETVLAEIPHVVLRRNQESYRVRADVVRAYLHTRYKAWLADRVRAGEKI